MNQRLGLLGPHALERDLALAHAAFGERQRDGRLERVDDRDRRFHVAARLASHLLASGDHRGTASAGGQLVRALSRLRDARARDVISRAKASAPAARSPSTMRSIRPAASASGGLDRLARHAHLDGLLEADEPGQSLRAFGARDDAQVHLGQSHLRVGDGDAVVSGHRDLEAAAERGAVHRHHDRLGAVLDALQELVHLGCAGITAPGDVLEPLDVGPRRKRPAGPNHDHGPHRRVPRHRVNRGADAVDDLLAEGVHRRVVDADERNAVGVRNS